jgi:hypothetical protein
MVVSFLKISLEMEIDPAPKRGVLLVLLFLIRYTLKKVHELMTLNVI